MGVLIDSSVLIDVERGRMSLGARLKGRENEEFFLSVISASELLHGVYRAADDGTRSQRSAFVEGVFDRFPLLEIDARTARMHAQIWAGLRMAGRMIGPNDLWIAASALAHGLTIATGNVREFDRVPGLVVETWN